jgi:hypothetical protein
MQQFEADGAFKISLLAADVADLVAEREFGTSAHFCPLFSSSGQRSLTDL